jgi:hypothetical protein
LNIVILQSNYIPWKGYFELITDADVFCFYDEVQYTKNDWRNRNQLINNNGLFWLTIPIQKDAVKVKISEVELPKSKWQLDHLNIIYQTYKKSAQFEIVYPFLEEIYLNDWNYLSNFNQSIIKKICEFIGIKTKVVNSKDYELKGDKINRLIHLIKQLNGKKYISGPTGKDYLNDFQNSFIENNIELEYKQYGPYSTYKQNSKVFNNFVSIIDLLMFVPQDELNDYIKSNYDSIQ